MATVRFYYNRNLNIAAVMTSFDQTSTQSKTVRFVGPGDSFGDSCLMNGCARECTTISKEFIELLVLRDEVRQCCAHSPAGSFALLCPAACYIFGPIIFGICLLWFNCRNDTKSLAQVTRF